MTHRIATAIIAFIALLGATDATASRQQPVMSNEQLLDLLVKSSRPRSDESRRIAQIADTLHALPAAQTLDTEEDAALMPDTTIDVSYMQFPVMMKLPPLFTDYSLKRLSLAYDPLTQNPLADVAAGAEWAAKAVARDSYYDAFMQNWMIRNPELVKLNRQWLAEPPKEFVASVDPASAKITIKEVVKTPKEVKTVGDGPKRINWLRRFDGSLQFSQAYLSPNWYQGGNSNLMAIANLFYNVKLNPAYHPNLIFETTAQYKLGANNAPDDSVHQYNISEDLLQINTTFGVKAARRWYYSVNAQFKTQLLNNYKKNSHSLAAAMLSPGELNVGVGMTYTYQNPRKTVDFNASIAPLSYNLKTCTNDKIDPTQFGIKEGHTTVSQYGSSAELTLKWKLCYNIEYFSRLFIFTNYEYLQGDWEHTIDFHINRFLTTKIYAHLRYDSQAPTVADTKWRHWQLKEILSIGFSYQFKVGL